MLDVEMAQKNKNKKAMRKHQIIEWACTRRYKMPLSVKRRTGRVSWLQFVDAATVKRQSELRPAKT